MRFPLAPLPVLLGVLFAACGEGSPTQPDALSGVVSSYAEIQAADASCTLKLHAILREAGSTAAVGQVQFRIDPPEPGSDDAIVHYRGVYRPAGDLSFDVLSVSVVSRVPAQTPTWTDIDKSDPGTTVTSLIQFGRAALMNPDLALALVDAPSSFKAVVNVVGSSGGQEAEGIVEPDRTAPEPLQDHQRLCFGGE